MGIIHKLKLGPHYSIERFGILFLTLTVCMTGLIGTMVLNKVKNDKQTLSGQAVYTQNVVTSKTKVSGTVNGVYTNKDHTKAFVLLKFSSMSQLPVDASNYTMFLTGSSLSQSKTDLKSRPSGGIYVFGSSGYVGLYFVDMNGFQSQILDVVVRSLKDLSTDNTVNMSMADGDRTFAQFDQFRVYFNPGGLYATQAEFLEADDLLISDIYEEIITRPAELAARNELTNDLSGMRSQLVLMDDYMSRLDAHNIDVSEIPMQIEGDTITAKSKDGVDLVWSTGKNAWVDASNNVYADGSYYLYLNTDYVKPGGYDFVWQTGSVKDGYLDDLAGDLSWNAFFESKQQEAKEKSAEKFTTELSWHFKDGTEFVYDSSSDGENGSATRATINSEIGYLKSAWETYYELKNNYQTSHLSSLLYLERDMHDIWSNYTVNCSDGVLTLW